jgi:hypothetical protein
VRSRGFSNCGGSLCSGGRLLASGSGKGFTWYSGVAFTGLELRKPAASLAAEVPLGGLASVGAPDGFAWTPFGRNDGGVSAGTGDVVVPPPCRGLGTTVAPGVGPGTVIAPGAGVVPGGGI